MSQRHFSVKTLVHFSMQVSFPCFNHHLAQLPSLLCPFSVAAHSLSNRDCCVGTVGSRDGAAPRVVCFVLFSIGFPRRVFNSLGGNLICLFGCPVQLEFGPQTSVSSSLWVLSVFRFCSPCLWSAVVYLCRMSALGCWFFLVWHYVLDFLADSFFLWL